MKKNPLVTICFLTYNYAQKLEKALKPLINQSYQNIQIIISDNQSTDNTEEVARKIASRYQKVVYRKNIPDIKIDEFNDISNKDTTGRKKTYDVVFNHCNSCLKSGIIQGELVIFCHQDDIYHEDIVKDQVDFLTINEHVPAVFTLGNIINEHDKIIGKYKLPKELRHKNIYYFEEIFKGILNHGNTFLIAPTFMARIELFEHVGLFNDQGPFGGSDDLEMWLRILERYPIGIIHKKLINWRVGGRGKKYNNLRTSKADFFKVMDYYLEEKKYSKKNDIKSLRQYHYQKDFDDTLRSMNFLINGDVDQAKKIINSSFSRQIFLAFFENVKIIRVKVMALKIILFLGVNLGFGKYLGKILQRIV
ncbi:MAG: glycosyltransferase [Candidatus Staskawiczbacteria bacterium]|nr:glycosyltransferase [Candidatus Staskawiczbacteria bacterium]